jgi:hypothetical protein
VSSRNRDRTGYRVVHSVVVGGELLTKLSDNLKLVPSREAVTKGEVQLGSTQISEIVPHASVKLAEPLQRAAESIFFHKLSFLKARLKSSLGEINIAGERGTDVTRQRQGFC